MYAKFSKCAF
jgi:hypothetical protein